MLNIQPIVETNPWANVEIPQSKSIYRPLNSDGIADHSSDERYVIFAHDNQTPEGCKMVAEYMKSKNISFKPAMGCFNGDCEHSWIVNARDWYEIAFSGFVSRQSSILYLWPMSYGYAEYGRKLRKASMIYSDGLKDDIGTIQAYNSENDLPCDSWTYCDGYFWSTRI